MPRYDLWKHPDNGRWYITWTERGGRSVRRSTGTTDRQQAELVRAAHVLNQDQPAQAKPDEITVAAILDTYYERHAKTLPSGEAANIAIRHLTRFYGLSAVSAITEASHQRYKALCIKEGVAIGTINRRRGFLRAALRQAMKRGELTAAPFVPSDPEPAPRPHAMTRPQAARLLWAARDTRHIALFIRLALYTGARRGAVLQLTWDRVDLETGIVDFRLPGVEHARKRRAITPVPAKLLSSLRRAAARAKSGHVIEWRQQPLRSVKTAFRAIARAAGLPWVTPHVLKHTAVTWGLRVASPWMVQGMTATSLRTLQRVYGKHMAEDLRETAEAIASSKSAQKPRK